MATTPSIKPSQTMFKSLRVSLLAFMGLLGVMTFSCSKQDPAAELAPVKISQSATEDLVTAMAGNQAVKDQINQGNAFLGEYAAWVNGLTDAEKATYKAAFDQAVQENRAVADPSHTAAQTEAFFAQQQALDAEIADGFLTLKTLATADQAEIATRVFNIVTGANPTTANRQDCRLGWYVCSRGCSYYVGSSAYRYCLNNCYNAAMACIYGNQLP